MRNLLHDIENTIENTVMFSSFFFIFIYCNVQVKCTYSKCDAGKIGLHFGTICLYPLYRKQCCVNTNMCLILENLL